MVSSTTGRIFHPDGKNTVQNEKGNKTMNNNQNKWFRWFLRFVAFVCFIAGILGLILCAKMYIKNVFAHSGGTINPKVFEAMIELGKIAYLGIIPSIIVLLLMSSLLMWICSRKFKRDGN
jgi:ABC-type multidrug transport system permease subunit